MFYKTGKLYKYFGPFLDEYGMPGKEHVCFLLIGRRKCESKTMKSEPCKSCQGKLITVGANVSFCGYYLGNNKNPKYQLVD